MNEVIGAIRDKWLALGGEAGLGQPLDGERPTFDGQGRAQSFSGGATISWHPELGAFAVWGSIGQKWISLGREQFGYPITDESPCPDGRGRFNHFRAMQLAGHPDASVYWTPRTGAHEVHGAIRRAWETRGWERGPLGYPTSDEHASAGHANGRRSDFEHGFIDWTPQGGAKLHGPVPFDDGTALNPVND
ncbi:hypothetical protein [Kribbella sp. NPDC023855]|uniref:LGFP repeat-containing protein n=1 Tax=Kribbella sp. NPDC023855 TaxID=3154698 RepID=UPI0033FDB1E3